MLQRLPGAKKKAVKFGEETVFVYEVRAIDVRRIFAEITKDTPEVAIVGMFLPLCCNITEDEFMELYHSEQIELLEAFKEINRPFWTGMGMVKLQPVITNALNLILLSIQNKFMSIFAGLLPQDTPTPTTTDGETSLKQYGEVSE
jgi:hypothetical protein